MRLISCGIFDKKYIYFFIFHSLIIIFFLLIIFYYFKQKENSENKYNILLILLLNYFGEIFFFIPELILKYFLRTKKEKPCKLFKKEKKSLVIEYIFNDLSDNIIKYRDIAYIFCASLLLLIIDYIKILI